MVRHPGDAVCIVNAGWRLRPQGWWRRSPYLPVPDEAYWRFRMTTATGDPDGVPTVAEVVAAARWSRAQTTNG